MPESELTVGQFWSFYHERFVPAYQDLITLRLKKNYGILSEESNILSHISQFNYDGIDADVKRENLKRAYTHLQRVTLDVNKMAWREIKSLIDKYILEEPEYRMCFNIPESEALGLYKELFDTSREVRRFEAKNIGGDPLATLEKYEHLNEIGFMLWKEIDDVKVSNIKALKKRYSLKELCVRIAIASTISVIISSAITLCIKHWLN